MLGERLCDLREKKNLSQAEIARRVGVSRSLYNKYERANVRPPDDVVVLLARELDSTYGYIVFGNTDDPTPPDAKEKSPAVSEDVPEVEILRRNMNEMDSPQRKKVMKVLGAAFENFDWGDED